MATSEYILQTEGLTKEFKGFVAVAQVNLRVRRGQIHALIGPNGAGKTTCFNLLTKFLTPTSGRILFQGIDITNEKPAAIARRGIVRSFQISAVFGHLSVLENVRVALQRKLGTSFHFGARQDSELAERRAQSFWCGRPGGLCAAHRGRAELRPQRARSRHHAGDDPQRAARRTDAGLAWRTSTAYAADQEVSADRTVLMATQQSVVASIANYHRAGARRHAGRRAVRVCRKSGRHRAIGQRAGRAEGRPLMASGSSKSRTSRLVRRATCCTVRLPRRRSESSRCSGAMAPAQSTLRAILG